MKKVLLFLLSLLFIALSLPYNNKVSAQEKNSEKLDVVYFYAVDCPHCQKIEPLIKKIKKEYGNKINFLEYDVKIKEKYRQLFYHFVSTYNVPNEKAGTPLIFIGKKYLAGSDDIKQNLENEIEQKNNNENLLFDYSKYLQKWPDVDKINFIGGGGKKVCSIDSKSCDLDDSKKKVSLALIVTTAAIDSINPCAIAVLIFLITVLILLKASRLRMLKIGFLYIGAVFVTYYLAGLGIIRIITQFDIAKEIGIIAGIIVLLAGFLEIKEGLYPDKKQLLRIPKRTKPIFTRFLKKGTAPSVIIAGVLVSAFELPCTGQVYLAILSMLSNEGFKSQGYFYLFIYNIIFVLPLVIILLIATWGFDINHIKKMRVETRMIVKILIGILMIGLGIFLLFQNNILRILGM